MGLLDKIFRSGGRSAGTAAAHPVSSVPPGNVKDFKDGDLVECRICHRRLTVSLSETSGLQLAGVPGGGRFFPIRIRSGKMTDLTGADVKGIALRCKNCSGVFCWDCSHGKSPSCPSCGSFGNPYWFTHVAQA
jgi:hypothetical protein